MPHLPYLTEFIAIATVHFLALIAPGPDFTVIISQSVRFGRKTGIYTALGIGSGIAIHVIYTLLGVGALINSSHYLRMAAQIIGALYILYLAFKLIRSKAASSVDENNTTESENKINKTKEKIKLEETPTFKKSFLIGFLTNATNPKVTLFFLAIFTTVVDFKTPLTVQSFYGFWMCLSTTLWFILVSFLFSNDRVRRTFLKLGHWFDRLMGVLLLAFAGKLLFNL